MESHPLRNFLLIAFLVVILVLAFLFLKQEKPYQVLTPAIYPAGTTVSLYKNPPPGFPSGVILEGQSLTYSGVVTSPDGKEQMTVSYLSYRRIVAVVNMYKTSLFNSGWKVFDKAVSINANVILATKNGQNLLVTITQAKDAKTMVTFQYEK